MSRILFLSRSLYPKKGGSAFVTENLASNFNKNNLVVIGGKAIGARKAERQNGPNFFYLTSQINIRGRGERFFFIFRVFLFPLAFINAIKITRSNNVKAVLATFPDGFFLLLAFFIAKYFKIPFSSYFHNTYIENRKGLSKYFAIKIQKIIFRESRVIYVMSDGMLNFYKKYYPEYREKFKTLLHSFQSYPQIEEFKFQIDRSFFKLAFIGNFNESNIEATKRIVDLLGRDKRFELNFYTPVPKALLAARGINTNLINFHGYINDSEFYEVVSKNTACVLTHGFFGGYSQIEYQTIFPTRTIPFLLSNLPIIIHSPPNSYLSDYFLNNKVGLVITTIEELKIKRMILDFITNKDQMLECIKNVKGIINDFYGPNVSKILISDFSDVI